MKKQKAKVKERALRIYRARIIDPISSDKFNEFRDGALVVNELGRIIFCGNHKELASNARGSKHPGSRTMDLRGHVIIPGLIDCHIHLPQLDLRGRHGSTLLGWLERYIFPAEKAFADIRTADDVGKRFFKKLILNGTTTAAIYTTIHAKSTEHVFKLAKAAGIRAVIGKMMMDQNAPAGLEEDTIRSLKESEDICSRWHNSEGGRLKYAFTPRFAPTCSEELMTEVGKLAAESGAYIQTHISENRSECDMVKRLFPDYDDYVAVYEENGCLGPRTLLAHAIHLSDSEMRRIAGSRTKLVHCPTSNFFLKSGRMPAERIEAHGIHYGLGTDVGAGTSMSMFTTMRHADYIQPGMTVTPAKAFYLATLGGAKALSLDAETGSLAVGKAADFIVVDICGIDPRYRLSELSSEEVLSLLMYRGQGSVIKRTFVNGIELDVDVLRIKGERISFR